MCAVYADGSSSNASTNCLLPSAVFVHLPRTIMSSLEIASPRAAGSTHTSTSAWPAVGEM